jgi:U3 small nucleolar ribonucleoprotein protein IMP4
MRHDVPNVGPMSEQYPHLIFSNLTSKLGQRTSHILKYLFPVPKEDSHRTITFVNQDDYISFRFGTTKINFFKINFEFFLVIIFIKKMKVKLN